MLIEIPPKYSVSSVMGYLKGKSSVIIYSNWGNARYKYRSREFWCRGYYVDTVGKNTKKIKEYIANQLKEDQMSDQMVMDDFVQAFRKCMEQIKTENPQIEKVLVFPAMPNSLAIRMGMDYMPKTDPVLEIYDQLEAGKKFVKTILIGET